MDTLQSMYLAMSWMRDNFLCLGGEQMERSWLDVEIALRLRFVRCFDMVIQCLGRYIYRSMSFILHVLMRLDMKMN